MITAALDLSTTWGALRMGAVEFSPLGSLMSFPAMAVCKVLVVVVLCVGGSRVSRSIGWGLAVATSLAVANNLVWVVR